MDIKLAKAEDVEQLRKEVKNLAETGVAGKGNLFATCTDTRNTLAKTVTVSDSELFLTDGLQITIRFYYGLRSTTHAEGATTLNINGTGAKELWINGVDATDVDDSVANIYVDNSGAITVMYNEASDTYAIVGRESFNGSGTGELADAAIEERHISNGAVKERHIANGAVGADQLMDISVGTKKVIDGAITEEKLDPTYKDTLATKSDLAQKADENDLRTAESKITANTEKITILVGDDTGKSVRKIANEELAARLIKNAGNEASLNTLQEIAEWIANHPDDAAAMNAAITALQDVLSGLGTNKGDVKKYIDNAIAALNMGDYAKASELTAVAGQASDVAYKLNSFLNTGYEGTPEYVNIKEIADDIKSVRESVPSLDGYATEEYLAEELTKRGQLKPEFANSIEECTDTSKLYVLPDGYIYAYVKGTRWEQGYTNLVSTSKNADGTIYNDNRGYMLGYRLNSAGEEKEQQNTASIGFIPVAKNSILRIKPFANGSYSNFTNSGNHILLYNSSYALLTTMQQGLSSVLKNNNIGVMDDNSGIYTVTLSDILDNDNIAFVRLSCQLQSGAVQVTEADIARFVVTVDEEIVEGSYIESYAWTNTGYAFVPADYESRIVDIEKETADHASRLKLLETSSSGKSGVPDYVIKESESVINKVLSAQKGRTFNIASISDLHNNDGDSDVNILHACQGVGYIADRVKIDVFACLGDHTDSTGTSDWAECLADILACNNYKRNYIQSTDVLELIGNHDYNTTHAPMIYKTISAFSTDVVWGNRLGGYFYKDYEDYKLRIIGLNTSEVGSIGVSSEQYNWFIETLDLSLKENASDWQTLILSHVPLDWSNFTVFSYVLQAYINGTSWTNGTYSCNYTDKNQATIIGCVHGHTHNFLVDRLYLGNSATSTEQINVYRIAIPEVTESYSNHYSAPFRHHTTYSKTNGTACDTSFNVLCIDLDNREIKAICYGAGIDRTIKYTEFDGISDYTPYTNQIPLSINSDGTKFVGENGEDGYKVGYRISTSTGDERDASGLSVTGFIPATNGDTIRIKNIELSSSDFTWAFYDDSFSMVSSGYCGDTFGEADENGVYTKKYSTTGSYIRISGVFGENPIITVNEEIV